ncbi:alpha/beta fold hydrolase [Naasia lichenicola]|nr:alpha/beta hydrolase [Naasia lichenicola]
MNNLRSHPRRLRAITLAAGAFAAFALLVAGQSQIASATPSPATHPQSGSGAAKPSIVLVHGAWADGSSFTPVTLALQAAGYKVLVAPNPLRSLENDTKVLADFLAQKTSGPVVLVGHSYGGMVMTGAASGNANVKALVYIDAYAPDAGESAQSLTNAQPGSLLNVPATDVFDFVLPAPDAPQALYDSYIKLDKFKAIFAASLPTVETNLLAASQSPAALASIGSPFVGTPAWKTVPSWFVIGTADQLLPKAEQEIMAKRSNGQITRIDAPHLSMLAKPLQVTKVILDAARSVK